MLATNDLTHRAALVLDAAAALGVTQFKISPHDIAKGNEKLNMAFVAAIFNALPGLAPPDENAARHRAAQPATPRCMPRRAACHAPRRCTSVRAGRRTLRR